MSSTPNFVTVADPPPRPPSVVLTTGLLNCEFILSTRIHAERYDILIRRAASLMEPQSRISSRILTFPGPRGRSELRYRRSSTRAMGTLPLDGSRQASRGGI